MSTSATGRLVAKEDGMPLPNLTIVARDVSGLFSSDLASQVVGTDGRFRLRYDADGLVQEFGPRTIEFRVLDRAHRTVVTHERQDVEASVLDLSDVTIPKAEATGWLVTLGTGTATPPVTQGNAVGLLVDNVVAWRRVADVFRNAVSSIEFMQLFFDIPSDFDASPVNEEPEMVLEFGSVLSATALRAVDSTDVRPERLLLDALMRNPAMDIRILLNRPVLDGHLIGASIILPGLGLLIVLVGGLALALGKGTSLNEVRNYFERTALLKKKMQGATTSVFGPTHAKLAIVDGFTAVSIASPFDQGYFGDAYHDIDDPRRGNKDTVPIHDVSFMVTGPAVFDLHETYRLHWNAVTDPPDHLDTIPVPSKPLDLDGLDAFASLQVIRTLGSDRFDKPEDGEKGVLEAYLRAIANAESYIYLENQYLTNDAIGTALLQALTDHTRPNLNVILMVNIDPDIPCYPRWQRKLITRIREGMIKDNQTEEQRRRFGAFTRWTHEAAAPPDQPNPRIAPNYIHSKVGIVDDKWATLGSANLDGASLDYFQFLHAVQFGDVRNSEVNFLILNGIAGEPPTPAVDILRRHLWAEHLGLEDSAGVPNINDPFLAVPPAGGWVQLWHSRAAEKLNALKTNPGSPIRIRILPWPDVDETLNFPRAHLAELLEKDLDALDVDPIIGTRRFSFKKGSWRDDTVELDPLPRRE
ncbi:MAG: phospholipase D-like domain-containing protein [Pseudonocardiaceae bacterium]